MYWRGESTRRVGKNSLYIMLWNKEFSENNDQCSRKENLRMDVEIFESCLNGCIAHFVARCFVFFFFLIHILRIFVVVVVNNI